MKRSIISKQFYSVFLTTMLIFVAGVCVGGGVAAFLPPAHSKTVADAVTNPAINTDRLRVFAISYINFLKPIVFIWLCRFFRYGICGVFSAVIYRGFILGYYIAALTKSGGVLYALKYCTATLLPHYPMFIATLTACVYFAVKHYGNTDKKVPYFIYLFISATGCAIAALCDAYVSVLMIGLIS